MTAFVIWLIVMVFLSLLLGGLAAEGRIPTWLAMLVSLVSGLALAAAVGL